jgi:hypothetical protein
LERLLVAMRTDIPGKLREYARTTRDGHLIDLDIFEHESTFTLEAFGHDGAHAFAPIVQPLMIEHLIFRPGLTVAETGQAIVRLAEHALEEAYRRDTGDVYFLGHDESTCNFAERYGFKELSKLETPLRCYRLNLLETFGHVYGTAPVGSIGAKLDCF